MIKMFCIPHAGGSKSAFNSWNTELNTEINMEVLELSGHGSRFGEMPNANMQEAADDLFEQLRNKIDEDYILLGHSMGSILAYELYHRIRLENLKLPKYIFFSGHEAPQISVNKVNCQMLSDSEFVKMLMELGGMEPEILNNVEVLRVLLPIIRHDFQMLYEYTFIPTEYKIDCPVSVLYGNQDRLDAKRISAWKRLVKENIDIKSFSGNHFYLFQNKKDVLEYIMEQLSIKQFKR